MSYSIRYKRMTVKVSGEKPDICDCCMHRPNPKGLHMHHWKYGFTAQEIAKNPELSKKNTSPLCYSCHRVANAMRIVEENKLRSDVLLKLREKVME
jgi:hypothetical protein